MLYRKITYPYVLIVSLLLIILGCSKDEGDDRNPNEEALNAISSVGEGVVFAENASYAELMASDVVRVHAGNTTFFIGYRQLSANNQDAILAKFVEGEQVWVRTDYETTGDDSRGYGILWDGSATMYAVFSVTGTQGSSEEDFRRFSLDGWHNSYGQGGGPKAAVVLKINPDTGEPEAGTFVMARLANGNANSLKVKSMELLNSGNLKLKADSWFSPLHTNKTLMECSGDSPFDYTLELSSGLEYAVAASADGCN